MLTKHFKRKYTLFYLGLFILIAAYLIFSLVRSSKVIAPKVSPKLLIPIATASKITWPTKGESAVGVVGTSVLDSTNPQVPEPTASTAKMVTCLMVLKAKPLSLGEQGPLITITPADVAIYNNYVAEQGSVVKVVVGEQISEYQMLEAILLPSANNMADSLASWAYGSLANYDWQANKFLVSSGLTSTHIGIDASGFSPTTTSTASDLVKIGELVMANPVLTQIVAESSATNIPIVGNISNVNYLLNKSGIIGIKTGNTTQAGGVFVSASKEIVGGKTYEIITANMAAPNLVQAISGSLPLIQSAQSNIYSDNILPSGSLIGTYVLPWNKQEITLKTNASLSDNVWGGSSIYLASYLDSIKYPSKSSYAGYIQDSTSVSSARVNVSLESGLSKPSYWWKLTHPL